ncbi:hypothetical protein mRhiFer1_009251 [Rhinolophus ferrumequinum]|uniref:Uncharacterized protein n=1 Tax=Rhinolophus ferrumequinum TaxID=59479 RepID=A0A7J7S7Y2_RHIFE|nr:hypothetical protein mRhiFer1_009251 [Rhinolophus ferrumequinum]
MEDRGPELGAPHPGLRPATAHGWGLGHEPWDLLARVDVLRHQQGCATETWQLGSNSPEAFVGEIGASGARREDQVAEAELGTLPSTFRKLLHTDHMPSSKAPPEALAEQLRPHPVSDRRPLCLLQWKAWPESADNTARGHCLR